MPRILELPAAQRPRERLLAGEAHVMRPSELLALVLGTGRGSGEDALQLAERVVTELGGVEALAAADVSRLREISGIGPVKATRIRAAFELALRAGVVEPELEIPEPDQPPVDPVAATVQQLRACIPIGERAVLAFDPTGGVPIIPLTMGQALGRASKPGAFLAQLLSEGVGPWWIVSIRPEGEPGEPERAAAARLIHAAELVGVPIERLVAIGPAESWPLGEASP